MYNFSNFGLFRMSYTESLQNFNTEFVIFSVPKTFMLTGIILEKVLCPMVFVASQDRTCENYILESFVILIFFIYVYNEQFVLTRRFIFKVVKV